MPLGPPTLSLVPGSGAVSHPNTAVCGGRTSLAARRSGALQQRGVQVGSRHGRVPQGGLHSCCLSNFRPLDDHLEPVYLQ